MVSQAERRTATQAAIVDAATGLFGAEGFAATSIDDVAAKAGLAKGAIYHHFASKEVLFTAVLHRVQSELAARRLPPEVAAITDPAEQFAVAVRHYLGAICEPATRQIVFLDGPAVVGSRKWREIDEHYFGAVVRRSLGKILGPAVSPARADAVSMLLMGAIMEAALVCTAAADPAASATQLAEGLKMLLSGLAKKHKK